MDIFLIVSLLILARFRYASSKYIEGRLVSNSDWEFLSRFCFLSDEGQFSFYFEYPKEYAVQNLLLYFDDSSQWKAVYKSTKNCWQKEAVLKPENNQVVSLSILHGWSGCKLVNTSHTGWRSRYQCRSGRKFKSSRERWWFFAVSHCGFAEGLDLTYKLWLTNGEDFLHKEFSADEFYIFPTHMAFFLGFAVMFCISIMVAKSLKGKQLFHTTYKLYMGSLGLETFSLFILSCTYASYGTTGVLSESAKVAGRVFHSCAELIFLLMVVLLGKGYTITVGRLSNTSTIKISVFMTVYTIVYIVLFIWERALFDPGLVLYLYESPPGYGLVIMRLIGWLWFGYSVFFTLKHYPEKAAFYYPLIVFYTIWFWAGPVVILIAMHAMALWTREKTVVGVEDLTAFLGYLFFLVLTRPSAANKNFPYHVKTSQIGVMEELPRSQQAQSSNQGNTATQLLTHGYGQFTEFNARGPDFSELFTVSSLKPKSVAETAICESGDASRYRPPGRLPPLENAPALPAVQMVEPTPRDPPSYDSLFTAH